MTGNIANLFTCVCGKPAKPRKLIYAEDESESVVFSACEECLARSENFLAKVRPIFDKMIEIGVPREIANNSMNHLLIQLTDDSMLEPPSAGPSSQ